MTASTKKLVCWAVVGSVMISIGIVLIPLTDFVILKFMEKEQILVPGSTAYPIWEEIPFPIHFQVWLWNLTNPKEYKAGGPARFVEIGPYTYNEYRPKININNYDNGTVSYMNWKTFFFNPDLSVGPESDRFYTLNVPVFSVANWLRNTPERVKNAWRVIHEASGAEPVMELSVGDFLTGYSDKYLELAQNILGENIVPTTNFGILLFFNDSDDGVWSVHTGENDLMMLNQMDLWNREKLLPFWTTDYANTLNGTDGTFFHPFISREEDLFVFTTYICRSGPIIFKGLRNYNGVQLYHFGTPEYLYEDPTKNPTNIDFCTPDQSTCPPSGLINASECYFKTPLYVSQPHFLYGDESLFESVIGMEPVEAMHEIAADIDPLTGVTFSGNLRAQINLKVEPYDYISGTENLRELYFPLLWLNESASLEEEYVRIYKNYVQIPQYVVLGMIVLLISVGGGIVIGLINLLAWRAWKVRREGKEITEIIEVTPDVPKDIEENSKEDDVYENPDVPK